MNKPTEPAATAGDLATTFAGGANRLASLTPAQQEALVTRMNTRWRRATTQIQPLIEESRRGWDFYLRNHPSKQDLPGKGLSGGEDPAQSGLRLGLIPRSVDSVVAMLRNSLFPADEHFFRATPKDAFSADWQYTYEQYRVHNFARANTTDALGLMLLSMCIDPAAAIALPWKRSTRKKVVYEPVQLVVGEFRIALPALGLKKRVDPNYVDWEGTDVQCLDFTDWRVDPAARCLEDTWFARRWYAPVHTVREQYDVPADVAVTPYAEAWQDEAAAPDTVYSKGSLNGVMTASPTAPIDPKDEPDGARQAMLMVMYDDFVLPDATGGDRVFKNHAAVVLNGRTLVWFGPNPYHHGRKPYLVCPLLALPNQIYGVPLIRHALTSAAIVDTAMSKALKIAAWAADPIFEVDVTEPALRKTQHISPGMKIPVKRPNALRQVPVSVANLSLLLDIIRRAEENVREVTGASPLFTGEDFSRSPANITAFQVDQHVQGANSRFAAMMKTFIGQVIEPMLIMTFENDRQYKTKTEYVNGGGGHKTLTPDDVRQMEFDWVVTSAQAALSRGRQLANMLELLRMAPDMHRGGLITYAPGQTQLNTHKLLMDILSKGGTPNADQYLEKAPHTDPVYAPSSPVNHEVNPLAGKAPDRMTTAMPDGTAHASAMDSLVEDQPPPAHPFEGHAPHDLV
ncbi:MAG: hypothetical protein KC474_11770 [Cyanobacteria bacterium HKST-UBA04]|nr:hypothetical protein [Cyanobacteria bacterium HKST-UBA04]